MFTHINLLLQKILESLQIRIEILTTLIKKIDSINSKTEKILEYKCSLSKTKKELDEALKRSEVVPSDQAKSESASVADGAANEGATTSTDQVDAASANEQTAATDAQTANGEIDQTTTQIQDAPKDISNPF